jgi:hypothetical protein
MKYHLIAVMSLVAPVAAHAQSESVLPPFLPPYYANAFNSVGNDMTFKGQENKDNLSRYTYGSPDRRAALAFESFSCERDRCQTLYQNAVQRPTAASRSEPLRQVLGPFRPDPVI